MIYITGDTHADREFILHSPKLSSLTKDDCLIVCGDFGFLFWGNDAENDFLDALERRPYTILFVDGNHENFDLIYSYPVAVWNGGRVHKIRKNVLHLMRGEFFNIEGKSFFAMGGAYSIDKGLRTEGSTWWSRELPSNEEYQNAIDNLTSHNFKVDYIITHTMPKKIIMLYGFEPAKEDGELTGFFDWVIEKTDFKHWYCGHWHDDKDITEKVSVLLKDVRRIQ